VRPGNPYEASQLRAPLPRPGKLIAAPVNYADHKQEMKVEQSVREYGLFLKATSSIVGPGEPIQLPYPDVRTDQEGELAVVVGRQARNVLIPHSSPAKLCYATHKPIWA
jgi:2-keto-4-pentenoate hydratase/2-oxohepta-3-ene-1,7-dioic acid hydratase in catechol pathway